MNTQNERDERIAKLEELKQLGIDPYPSKSSRDYKISRVLKDFSTLAKKEQGITIAGRLKASASMAI